MMKQKAIHHFNIYCCRDVSKCDILFAFEISAGDSKETKGFY